MQRQADQQRIEKTLMIDDQQHAAAMRDAVVPACSVSQPQSDDQPHHKLKAKPHPVPPLWL